MQESDLPPAGAAPTPPDGDRADRALLGLRKRIEDVTAWYDEQLQTERRRSVTDLERVRHLLNQRAVCAELLCGLPDSDARQLERIRAFCDDKLGGRTDG